MSCDLPQITPCPPSQRAAALDLVLQELPDAARRQMVRSILSDPVEVERNTAGLLVASTGGVPCAAVWAQGQPGNTAVLWRPVAKSQLTMAIAEELVRHAVDYLDTAGVSMAQTLLADPNDATIEVLRGAGFFHLADLSYLVCECERWRPSTSGESLQYESYQDSQQHRLADLLDQTYVDTLDCPELNGIRDARDVIDGYRASGESGASNWYFVRHADRDVGVLLLADHPGPRHWEIVYMAILPPARGSGWGLMVCEQAIRLAKAARQQRVVLAVDKNNRPAVRIYERAGFRSWDSRSVFIRRRDKS